MRHNSGFTLIELLIGMSMGIVVLGGVLAVYVPTLQTFKTAASHASLQDIEQLSYHIFGRKIRQSSLLVCGSNELLSNGVSAVPGPVLANWAFNFSQPFQAFSATNATPINRTFNNGSSAANLSRKRLRQSGDKAADDVATNAVGDIFYTLAPDGMIARIAGVNNSSELRSLTLQNTPQIKEGGLYLIHDCRFPVVLRASKKSVRQIKYQSTFQPAYDFGYSRGVQTVVSGYEPTVHYLGALDGKPALYARTIKAKLKGGLLTYADNPILTGIVNMRVEYGVDTVDPLMPSMATQYFTVSELAKQSDDVQSSPALSARITVMIEADQIAGDSLQQQLLFPTIDGKIVDCTQVSSIAHYDTACPDFVDFNKIIHKVMKFTFSLSQQTLI